jgi:hypothetical protein
MFFVMTVSFLALQCELGDLPSIELELPEATMTGENTFGCLVDGEVFRPKIRCCQGSSLHAYFALETADDQYNLVLSAERHIGSKEKFQRITINGNLFNLRPDMRYSFDSYWPIDDRVMPNRIDALYIYGPERQDTVIPFVHFGSFNQSGEIHFTKMSDGIISGTFWFDAVTEDGLDTVRIRDGRFDVEL